MTTTSNAVTVKPRQAARILKAVLPTGKPVLLVGQPGVGKTSIGEQVAADLGADLLVTHPVVSDPTDYKGMPWVVDGRAEFLPFGDLQALIEATSPTVCLIDDLGQAPASVQAALMQLLLARRINGHRVSDKVMFMAATNRKEDRAGVQGILEPVKGRFGAILHLVPDADEWCEWALGPGKVPPELVAFIKFRPTLLSAFVPTADMTNTPTPRNVAAVGTMLQVVASEDRLAVFAGACGLAWATEFVAFVEVAAKLPDARFVLANPEQADVPTNPSVLYAACGMLAKAATPSNWPAVVKYAGRLPAEFGVLLVDLATKRDVALTKTRQYAEWTAAHAGLTM
jgi:hypothetical protein